jgi:hypothetical protein
MSENTAGTSNAVSTTYTLPITAKTITDGGWSAVYYAYLDNGSVGYAGVLTIPSGGTTVTFQKAGGAGWTNSGAKRIAGANFHYEI